MHFLYISRGSLYETVTLLTVLQKLNWISAEKVNQLEQEAIEIAKMLNGLIKSIKTS
ncbi:four helix bundle protein [Luteibaculum oceani]|uniref:Four helix bundle protein n=1 Tax=Luteibaculum oceani TaxID=1294296 RepID=A0A5C6VD63_9FLAO|nr:four helix bundle protein [Luteibaculum oceani]